MYALKTECGYLQSINTNGAAFGGLATAIYATNKKSAFLFDSSTKARHALDWIAKNHPIITNCHSFSVEKVE